MYVSIPAAYLLVRYDAIQRDEVALMSTTGTSRIANNMYQVLLPNNNQENKKILYVVPPQKTISPGY